MGKKRDLTWRRDDVGQRRGASEREKRGDNASWVNANLTRLKNEENSCGRFSLYKWMVKI
jgi:hypothetical protein